MDSDFVNIDDYFERGKDFVILKKYTEAMQDFEKALEFNSSYVETLENLGICLQKLFGSDDAEWAFNFANAIKNGYNFKKFFLVMILWKN